MRWFRRAALAVQLLAFEDDVYSFRQRRRMALAADQERGDASLWVRRLCQGIGLTLVAGLVILVVMIATAALFGIAGAADLPVRPDPSLTPGAVLTTDAGKVCVRGYAKSVRHTPGKLKAAAYDEYGITKQERAGSRFEVDHLISLELGGADTLANLWPESYDTQPWNARLKDKLEDRLHALVCGGSLPLEQAQREIAADWISAYGRYLSR